MDRIEKLRAAKEQQMQRKSQAFETGREIGFEWASKDATADELAAVDHLCVRCGDNEIDRAIKIVATALRWSPTKLRDLLPADTTLRTIFGFLDGARQYYRAA